MPRTPLPPLATVLGFIDCINRGDLPGLARLMRDDHRLVVLDEPPLVGRNANVEAWKGYFSSFPAYVIYPRHLTAAGSRVTVLGSTTGSHLGLPDAEEAAITVIWLAEVTNGKLSLWQVTEDTPDRRSQAAIPPTV